MYAIFDELHQSFVPGRDPMLTDVAIDTVSGWVAAMVWVRFARAVPRASVAGAAGARSPSAGRRPVAHEVVAPAVHAAPASTRSAAHPATR